MVKTKQYLIESAKVTHVPNLLNRRLKKDELRIYKRSFTKADKKSIKVSIKWLNYLEKTEGIFTDLSRLSQHMTLSKIYPPIRKHNSTIDDKFKDKNGKSRKKAILYTRTSSRKVDNKEVSLSYQVSKCLMNLKKRKCYVEVLLEHNGVSGMSNHKRRDFQDIIFSPYFLEENNIEIIMVDTIERLTRNYSEFFRLIYMCHHHIKLADDYTNMNLLNPANHKMHKTIICTSDGRDSKNDYEHFMKIIEKAEKEHRNMCIRASRFHDNNIEKKKIRGHIQEDSEDSEDDEYNNSDSDDDILNDNDDDSDNDDSDNDDSDNDDSDNDDSDNDDSDNDDSDNDDSDNDDSGSNTSMTNRLTQLKDNFNFYIGRRHSSPDITK
jgi:hypothetical protein